MDRVFRLAARGIGLLVLAVMGAIGFFLLIQSGTAFDVYGWGFFLTGDWDLEADRLGVLALLSGTILVAFIAILIAFPLALGTALFISEYASPGVRRTLISLVDLMAAVPSVVYGLWGFFLLQDQIVYLSRWLHRSLGGVLPFFDLRADPGVLAWEQNYTSSLFIAGVVVAVMVLPVTCAVMREVFSQAPPGEREAALALGSTRWGMIRSVVLPFGRGGMIGGTMLGLGRALGETIAVVFIVSPLFEVHANILERGSITISSMIALSFGESTPLQLSALMMAGLVLFLFTLLINTLAAFVVARSRSGAATEI